MRMFLSLSLYIYIYIKIHSIYAFSFLDVLQKHVIFSPCFFRRPRSVRKAFASAPKWTPKPPRRLRPQRLWPNLGGGGSLFESKPRVLVFFSWRACSGVFLFFFLEGCIFLGLFWCIFETCLGGVYFRVEFLGPFVRGPLQNGAFSPFSQGVPSKKDTSTSFWGLISLPFYSTIVRSKKTDPFFLGFRRFCGKKDPWTEWTWKMPLVCWHPCCTMVCICWGYHFEAGGDSPTACGTLVKPS